MSVIDSIVKSSQSIRGQTLKSGGGLNINFQQQGVNTHLSEALRGLSSVAEWASNNVPKEKDYSEYLRATMTQDEINKKMQSGEIASVFNQTTVDSVYNHAGSLAQQSVHKELAKGIENGTIIDQQSLNDAFHKQAKIAQEIQALNMNIKPDNKAFLEGFAKGNDAGMMQLFNILTQKNSGKLEATVIAQQSDLYDRVIKDDNLMMSGQAGNIIFDNIESDWNTGRITSPSAKATIINNVISKMTTNQGGLKFLTDNADRMVEMNGVKATLKTHYGAEKWDLMIAKATQTQTNIDAKFIEDVELKLSQASSTQDLDNASRIIADVKSQVNYRFTDERMNPLRSSIINVEKQLMAKMEGQRIAIEREVASKQQEMIDYNDVMNRYRMAINNETVSLDPSNIPNMNKERFVKAANAIINNINENTQMSPEEKAKELNELLRVDRAEGPITAIMKDTADRAISEFGAMVLNGAIPSDPKYAQSFNSMKAMYDANPSLISMRFPELSAQLYAMEQAMDLGIPQETYMQYMQQTSKMSKEMKYEADKAWQETANKSEFMGLTYLPKELNDAARIVYETTLATTQGGDRGTNLALKAASEFAKKVAWKYDADKTTGKYNQDVYGAIPKSFLQVDTNLDSVNIGQDYLSKQVETLKQLAPLQNVTMRYVQSGDYVLLTASNGLSKRIYKEDLSGALVDTEQQIEKDKAIRDESLIGKSKRKQQLGQAMQEYDELVRYE